MDNVMLTGLYLANGKELFFEATDKMGEQLNSLANKYGQFNDYDTAHGFRTSMIKTAISDIGIESADDTTLLESTAAICCNKIKNKEQQSALNMIKLLESGILEQHAGLTPEYTVEIWRALTKNNRNFQASMSSAGFRRSGVRVLNQKGWRHQVIHKAPDASTVETMMNNLCTFYNNGVLAHSTISQFANAVLKSAIFSAYFVYVHPFLDGDGRTSRLLMNKLLVDHGLTKFRYISFSAEIVKHKKEYGKLLEAIEANQTGNITEYVFMMLNWMDLLFQRLSDRSSGAIDNSVISSRQKLMLNVIRGSAIGTYTNHYKANWNAIAKANGYKQINTRQAEADINKLLLEDLIVVDERYVLYPGFKYYKN